MVLVLTMQPDPDGQKATVADVIDHIHSAEDFANAIEMMASDIGNQDQKNALASMAYALRVALGEIGDALTRLKNEPDGRTGR